jgi:hypothetical protein
VREEERKKKKEERRTKRNVGERRVEIMTKEVQLLCKTFSNFLRLESAKF